MKLFRRLSLGYFVALISAALLQASAQAETIHNTAVVRAVRGSAQISSDHGKTWAPAKVGARMKENSMIKTAGDGQADLFLGENGPVVRVRENAELGIDKLELENTGIEKVIETKLDLKNGQILGSVKKMAAASKYEVKTPVGVAGIRGTEYSINSNGQVNVVSGTVVVVYVLNGVIQPAVTVGAGQQSQVSGTGTTSTLTGMSAGTLSVLGQEVTTLMVGITVNGNGTITVTTPGQPPITTNPDGTNPSGPTTTTTGPGPSTTGGNSTTTGPGPTTTGPLPPSDTTIVDISESAKSGGTSTTTGTTTGQH